MVHLTRSTAARIISAMGMGRRCLTTVLRHDHHLFIIHRIQIILLIIMPTVNHPCFTTEYWAMRMDVRHRKGRHRLHFRNINIDNCKRRLLTLSHRLKWITRKMMSLLTLLTEMKSKSSKKRMRKRMKNRSTSTPSSTTGS